MTRATWTVMVLLNSLLISPQFASAQRGQTPNRARAVAILDRAIVRMGGDSALRAVKSIRLDMMTQWLSTSLATRPFLDFPSFERNVELRDYVTKRWRNSRQPINSGPGGNGVVVIVRDTIAAIGSVRPPAKEVTWNPLSIAYVDDWQELLAFAPERLAVTLRDDPAAVAVADTSIGGVPHTGIRAVLHGWTATVFFRSSDDIPVMVRFLADETNDFGLAHWAKHEVEFWYSGWAMNAAGILLPRQRDVQRVGKPYKRMTVLAATVNAPAPADSFVISDEVAARYLATQTRPMWDLPLDSTRIIQDYFAAGFPPMLGVWGAIQVGGKWVVIETGVSRGVPPKVAEWFARATPAVPIGAGIASGGANGGIGWFLDRKLPVLAAPSVKAALPHLLRGESARGVTVVETSRWVRIGTDSLWVEPFQGTDFRGRLAIYSPTLRWLYLPGAGGVAVRAEQAAMIARLAGRGLVVDKLAGGSRSIVTPFAPTN